MKNNIQSILLGVLLIVCGYLVIRVENKQDKKSAYFQSLEVFEGFELQKELSFQLEKDMNERKLIMDSLELQLRVLYNEADKNEKPNDQLLAKINFIQEKYIKVKSDFQDKNSTQVELYNQQIWKQINQYVKEYGRLNNYSFIFGAQGDGSIMYADTINDITDEVLIFINNKYKDQ